MVPERAVRTSDGSMYEVHRLLFDLRCDDLLAAQFCADAAAVVDRYHIDRTMAAAVCGRDFAHLYHAGANPYLLYFGAVRMGVSRDDYYAALRACSAHESEVGDG